MNAKVVIFRCIEAAWCACLAAMAVVGAIAFLAAIQQSFVLQAASRGQAAEQVAGACEEPRGDGSAADLELASAASLVTAR
jgi:hypothetical protein